MKLPFWAEQDEVLQQIIRTKPVSDAIHSENFDQFTPNSTFTEDMDSFKETATASVSGYPSPVPEPDARLSPLSCKTYLLEMEKKEASMLLSKNFHQALRTHARHKSLSNLGTKSPARPRSKRLRARGKPLNAIRKSGKFGPRPTLRTRSYIRPSISA